MIRVDVVDALQRFVGLTSLRPMAATVARGEQLLRTDGPGVERIDGVDTESRLRRSRAGLSRLGVHRHPLGFTQEHLDELRREMGEGLGEDLTG